MVAARRRAGETSAWVLAGLPADCRRAAVAARRGRGGGGGSGRLRWRRAVNRRVDGKGGQGRRLRGGTAARSPWSFPRKFRGKPAMLIHCKRGSMETSRIARSGSRGPRGEGRCAFGSDKRGYVNCDHGRGRWRGRGSGVDRGVLAGGTSSRPISSRSTRRQRGSRSRTVPPSPARAARRGRPAASACGGVRSVQIARASLLPRRTVTSAPHPPWPSGFWVASLRKL